MPAGQTSRHHAVAAELAAQPVADAARCRGATSSASRNWNSSQSPGVPSPMASRLPPASNAASLTDLQRARDQPAPAEPAPRSTRPGRRGRQRRLGRPTTDARAADDLRSAHSRVRRPSRRRATLPGQGSRRSRQMRRMRHLVAASSAAGRERAACTGTGGTKGREWRAVLREVARAGRRAGSIRTASISCRVGLLDPVDPRKRRQPPAGSRPHRPRPAPGATAAGQAARVSRATRASASQRSAIAAPSARVSARARSLSRPHGWPRRAAPPLRPRVS